MKKIASLLAALALITVSVPVNALTANAFEAATSAEYSEQMKLLEENAFPPSDARYTSVTDGDFKYDVYEAYAFLTEYTNREAAEVTIPDSVNGVPVVGIKGYPFGFCHELEKITLPDSVRYFDWYSLVCTTAVRKGNVTYLSPEGEDAPVSKVREIVVSEDNTSFTFSDGILYSKDMKTLIGCTPASDVAEPVIPAETETIGDKAFALCPNLKKVTIPPTVKHICNQAFAASGIESVEFPENITSISGEMFFGCKSLKEVAFKGDIKVIGYGSFNGCDSLESFDIPDTVMTIGSAAFTGSACIENIDGVQYVDNWVVDSDKDIKKAAIRPGTVGIAEMALFVRNDLGFVDIPESVENVGDLAFASLSSAAVPTEVHIRNSFINEKNIAALKSATDVYIYDPQCDIFDGDKTIPPTYKYLDPDFEEPSLDLFSEASSEKSRFITGDIVIHGFAGSTAQEYAEKYNRKFELIVSDIVPGDANGDGKMDIADAVLLQKWLLGDKEAVISDISALDLCKDGYIDVFDLIVMKQMIAASMK